MATKETETINKALLRESRNGSFVWRNNTGAYKGLHGNYVKFGLPGSPDIIGIKPVKISVDMVGKTIGQFIGIEVKTGRLGLSKQQKLFAEKARYLGADIQTERDD